MATRAAVVGATRVMAAGAADTVAVVRPLLASEVKVERVHFGMCPTRSDGHTVCREVITLTQLQPCEAHADATIFGKTFALS